MARVRISITAMAYIQHAIDIISIPVSMVVAIFGDCVRLTRNGALLSNEVFSAFV